MDQQQPSESEKSLDTTTEGVVIPQHHQQASFTRRKSVLPILFAILIMIVGLGVGLLFMQNSQDIRSKASNTSSTLALSPASKQATVGETFSVGATINTNDDTVAAAELHLTYDPAAIQILNFTPQTGLVVLTPETHTNGSIAVTLGVPPSNPFKGSGIIGTWTVKTLANKQSSIAFTSATQVAALGKSTNALTSATGSTITTGIVTATATPAPTPGGQSCPPGYPSNGKCEADPTIPRTLANCCTATTPTPTITTTQTITPTPSTNQLIYIISEKMCVSVKVAPVSVESFTSLSACIGRLNEMVGATPTPSSVSPTISQAPTDTPTPTGKPTPQINPADLDENGKVTIIDYVIFMQRWWFKDIQNGDLNGDGKMSAIDYTIFMNGWNEYQQTTK